MKIPGLSYFAILATLQTVAPEAWWAVRLPRKENGIQQLTKDVGFVYVRHVFGDVYLLQTDNKERLSEKAQENTLRQNKEVAWFERQIPRQRVLHSRIYNDPFWMYQTYLHSGYAHMNATPAWEKGWIGNNVIVGVVDDGIITRHPDLQGQVDLSMSTNIWESNDNDPNPIFDFFSHGTRCAGIIAAKENNGQCGIGVAYDTKIAGIKLFRGTVDDITDAMQAAALTHQYQNIDIYSSSWGPYDNGATLEGIETLTRMAMEEAIQMGRNQRGVIYVFSTGNGGERHDSCAYNGYVNSIYTISISAIQADGTIPAFSEPCTAVTAVTYSREERDHSTKLVSPNKSNGCQVDRFGGTSPAAALASGVIAMLLSANQCLTWRDVQHLIARTSRTTGICEGTWTVNSAGYEVSDYCGFGLLNAGLLTEVGSSWQNVPTQQKCKIPQSVEREILETNGTRASLTVDHFECEGVVINYIEHVQVHVNISFPHRGHLRILLTSPTGTTSTIAPERHLDLDSDLDWTFLTLHHWGENATGTWRLEVQTTHWRNETGMLHSWLLMLYGTTEDPSTPCPETTTSPGAEETGRVKTENTLQVDSQTHCLCVNDENATKRQVSQKFKGLGFEATVGLSVLGGVLGVAVLILAVHTLVKYNHNKINGPLEMTNVSSGTVFPDASNGHLNEIVT